jgi:hypothetical protein
MPSLATKSKNRFFSIEDNGDGFDLSLFDGINQVGGAIFPDDGTGKAFELAYEIGCLYGNPISATDHIQQH